MAKKLNLIRDPGEMIVDLYDSSALKKALDDPNLQPQAKLIADFLIKNNKNSEILLKYSYLIVERDSL